MFALSGFMDVCWLGGNAGFGCFVLGSAVFVFFVVGGLSGWVGSHGVSLERDYGRGGFRI